jgi:ectoine hydroxylase-related dioxygenase (phytanoyl-CoA dioxygenase family)
MADFDAALDQYRTQGFTVIPGLLGGAMLAGLQDATDALLDTARHTDVETDIVELEPGHTRQAPLVRRIKKPHAAHPAFWDLARSPTLMQLVTRLIGPDVRLSHSKINTKRGSGGGPIEWHQDWAFAPHTNMDFCIVAVMLDDCFAENGPLQVVPGSHEGPLYDHQDADGFFTGAIDVAATQAPVHLAAQLVGPAGSVSIHHPMAIHGSAANRSGAPRRMMFLEYAAADAWPLFYAPEWDDYAARIVAGRGGSHVRTEAAPVKLPFPTRAPGSIFASQTQFKAAWFEPAA